MQHILQLLHNSIEGRYRCQHKNQQKVTLRLRPSYLERNLRRVDWEYKLRGGTANMVQVEKMCGRYAATDAYLEILSCR